MNVEHVNRHARRSVVTAALRAAIAWTQRDTEPGAWRELSRMTGVVSHALGPGRGPVEPLELVRLLRQPLAGLFGTAESAGKAADLVVLDRDDQLTDAAVEIGCEYTQALFDEVDDPGRSWLPSWAWQRSEQVQREVFEGLISGGDQRAYEATRRFLIEHPAGQERELKSLMNEAGARSVATYTEIPPDRQRAGVWWPCPVCRWPMRVRGSAVVCGHSRHEARFRIDTARGRSGPPRLVKESPAWIRTPSACAVDGARCVDLAVWRFVTVPGVPELALERRLSGMPGVDVEMWPDLDRVDLAVTCADGQHWDVDVKDHVDLASIIEDVPRAHDIVVPDYRRPQVRVLSQALRDKRIWTISAFHFHVRRRVR